EPSDILSTDLVYGAVLCGIDGSHHGPHLFLRQVVRSKSFRVDNRLLNIREINHYPVIAVAERIYLGDMKAVFSNGPSILESPRRKRPLDAIFTISIQV